MAEYTNLTTLDGLAVGDTITYDTTTVIDFKGARAKVELYGRALNSNYPGGYTTFVIDTSLLPSTILSFNNDYTISGIGVSRRNDLIYGDTDSLYYRIAVAGNAGRGSSITENGIVRPGKGGGVQGGNASNDYYANWFVNGGSQTTGGSLNKSATNYDGCTKYDGSFGSSNTTTYVYSGNSSNMYGGYGWYGGGAAICKTASSVAKHLTGGSGGSGFVIGNSTTTYPDGYLDDSEYLKSAIPASITEATLTQGGSTKTTPIMVLTILDFTESISGGSYYNGTEFIKIKANYYNGTEFIPCNTYRFNGTEFIKLS